VRARRIPRADARPPWSAAILVPGPGASPHGEGAGFRPHRSPASPQRTAQAEGAASRRQAVAGRTHPGRRRSHRGRRRRRVVAPEDLRMPDEAILAYRTALAADSGCADAHYNLSQLYEARGEGTAALRHLRTYRKLVQA